MEDTPDEVWNAETARGVGSAAGPVVAAGVGCAENPADCADGHFGGLTLAERSALGPFAA